MARGRVKQNTAGVPHVSRAVCMCACELRVLEAREGHGAREAYAMGAPPPPPWPPSWVPLPLRATFCERESGEESETVYIQACWRGPLQVANALPCSNML